MPVVLLASAISEPIDYIKSAEAKTCPRRKKAPGLQDHSSETGDEGTQAGALLQAAGVGDLQRSGGADGGCHGGDGDRGSGLLRGSDDRGGDLCGDGDDAWSGGLRRNGGGEDRRDVRDGGGGGGRYWGCAGEGDGAGAVCDCEGRGAGGLEGVSLGIWGREGERTVKVWLPWVKVVADGQTVVKAVTTVVVKTGGVDLVVVNGGGLIVVLTVCEEVLIGIDVEFCEEVGGGGGFEEVDVDVDVEVEVEVVELFDFE
jgi:hypothetical protein